MFQDENLKVYQQGHFYSVPIMQKMDNKEYVPWHIPQRICFMTYPTKNMFHEISYKEYVPWHILQRICSMTYPTKNMFHDIPTKKYLQDVHEECVIRRPTKKKFKMVSKDISEKFAKSLWISRWSLNILQAMKMFKNSKQRKKFTRLQTNKYF